MQVQKQYQTFNHNMNQKGFTFIELIVYIAIASMVLVSAVGIGWNLITNEANVIGKQEAYSNARTVMNHFKINIREADDVITGSSTFNTHPGVLTLDYPGAGTDVVFDTYTKNVTVGGQATTIRKLRIKEGAAAAVDITSDQVDVTDFTLTNLTRGSESKNINIELTIEKANPGNDPNFDASILVETALSVRK